MRKARRQRLPPVAPPLAAPASSGTPLQLPGGVRRHGLSILMIWSLALIAYANSFVSGFVFDNRLVILEDARIRAVTAQNLSLILNQEYWYRTSTTGLYRPVATLTYLFNYAILGNGVHPAGYHWFNFALHAANIALVYLLALLIFGESLPAFSLAALWAVHPVLTESVTNIVGRTDLLAALGVLGGLLCHIQAAVESGWRKTAWLAALAVIVAIGMFSKESAVVVIAVMLIYDLTFRRGPWRVVMPGYAAVAATLAIFFYVRSVVLANLPAGLVPFTDNPLMGAGFLTGRLTAIKVIGEYLGLLLWPKTLSCDYSYNQVPLFAWRLGTWEDWKVLLALAICIGTALLAFACYRRARPVFFFILFFFATLAPVANIALVIGTVKAERFLYLPSIGFIGCLVVAVYTVSRRWQARQSLAPAALAVVCLAFAARTYARNFDWRDDASLWASTLQSSPNSCKTHNVRADDLLARNQLDQAIAEANRSLDILSGLPDHLNSARPYAVAGECYRRKGWYQKALDVLLHGVRIDMVGDRAIQQASAAHGKRISTTGWPPLYLSLGRTYLALADPRQALDALVHGRMLRPDAEFFEEMSAAYRALNDPHQAAITLIEGIGVNPGYEKFASEVVEIYRQSDPSGCAITDSGGKPDLNTDCPLVRSDMCSAAQNVVALYRQMKQGQMAASIKRNAIAALGCRMELFN